MIRWDDDDIPEDAEWIEGPNGHIVRRAVPYRAKPQPESTEAHRRTRFFDRETGAIIQEIHEAVRTHFREIPDRKRLNARGADPPVVWAVIIGAALHLASWVVMMSVLVLSDWQVLALPIAAMIVWTGGVRFGLAQGFLVWGLGSLIVAFDGWLGLGLVMLIAGFVAPGKWVRGQW
jgi:hypothetical protein